MKIKKSKIVFFGLLLAFYSLLFFILLKNSFSYFDPDFGWHLKFGQEISKTGEVPSVNRINYTIPDSSLVDHEWLSNWFMYVIYERFGYVGLGVFFSFVALLVFLLQFVWASRRFLGFTSALWLLLPLQFFAVFASLPSFGIRAQELTVLFLVLTLFILDEHRRSDRPLPLFFLPPIFWLWASMHGGFMLGVALLFAYFAFLVLERVLPEKFRPSFLEINPMSTNQIKSVGVFAVLSLVATCLTPYGLGLYSFLGSYGNDFYLKTISEWLNQFRYPFIYRQLFFLELTSCVLLWWVLSVLWLKKKEARLRPWELFLFVLLMFMAFKSRRHFPLFAASCSPVIVFLLANSFGLLKMGVYFSFSKNVMTDGVLKGFLSLCLIVGVAVQAVSVRPVNDPWSAFPDRFPVDGAKFFKEHKELSGLRMFNNFNWGGYFIWVLPEEKLFIDGRLPQYPFEGRSILEEYKDFYNKDKIGEMLDKHDIESVFIASEQKPLEIRWWERKFFGVEEKEVSADSDGKNLLDSYLSSLSEWKQVYRDDVSVIYIKNK